MGKLEFGIGYLTTSARAAQGFKTTALKKNAPSESIIAGFTCCFVGNKGSSLPANAPDVLGCHRILKIVAEMSPQIIHHGGHLVVAHHRAEPGHSALPVDDH